MSYWIEYQAACFAVSSHRQDEQVSRFVIAQEGGSSNLTERSASGRERRVRSWHVSMIGTELQVLRQAVKLASDCEGMSLRVRGNAITPEAYLRRARRLMASPAADAAAHITLNATVPRHHLLVARAQHFGFRCEPMVLYGQELMRLEPPAGTDGAESSDWSVFFRTVDPFLDDGTVHPSQLGEVWGMPKS